MLEFSDKLDHE
jgi:hypothetical protein